MFSLTLEKLASMPEGQFYDRKSARKDPKEIAHHLIGFANAGGGFLAIGIEDDGEISGFHIDGAFSPEIFNNVVENFCQTTIIIKTYPFYFNHKNGTEDFVLLLKIEPSYEEIAKNTNNEIYLRLNDSTMKISEKNSDFLKKEKNKIRFEDLLEENSSIEDLDLDIVKEYQKILHSKSTIKEFLNEKFFLINDIPTKGAIILFGKKPSSFVPSSRLRYLFYKDDPEADTPKGEENISFKEGLISLLRKVKVILEPRLQKVDNSNFWYEDIVAMMIYRDFSHSWEYPRIILYNNSKLLYSPYSKPSYVNIENVSYAQWPRNIRITNTLIEFGWLIEINQGVKIFYSTKEE